MILHTLNNTFWRKDKIKMKKEKFLALVVGLVTVVSSLSACGNGKDTANKNGSANSENSIYTEVGTYPILKEGNTMSFSLFAPLRPGVTTYDAGTNKFSAYFEKKTGINFKWQEVNGSDFKQKLNIMMTGGEYTDAIMNASFAPSEQLLYGQQGILIPLNDLIDKYAPNLKALLEKYPYIRKNLTMNDGKIYVMPVIGQSTHMITPDRMWLNQDWLKRLNLEVPKTTDEFYNVLKEFKEKDANGNGDPNDEVPLSGAAKAWGTDPIVYLANAFIPTSPNSKHMTIGSDGKITYNKISPQWQECLRYMNKLYKDGLMDKMLYSQTKEQLLKLGSNPDISILGACGGGSVNTIANSSNIKRWSQYIPIPPIEGPNGVRSASRSVDYGKGAFAITNKCKNPEALVRAMDYFFTEDGGIENSLGCVGDGRIELAKDDDKNFIDQKPKYTRLASSDAINDVCWNSCGPRYVSDNHSLLFSCKQDGTPDIEKILYLSAQNDYIPVAQPMDQLVPPIAFDVDASRTIVDIETPMNTYIDQAMIEFITGIKDIDKDWDNYVKDVKNFGLDKYIETYQKEVDALKTK